MRYFDCESSSFSFRTLLVVFGMSLFALTIGHSAHADGIKGSGIADFYFDMTTGTMTMDTDETGQVLSILIEGPPALSIDRFADGVLDEETQTTWRQQYFNGKEQWINSALPLAGIEGEFQLATYDPHTVFGTVAIEYGARLGGDGKTVFTDVTMVPEPAAPLALILLCGSCWIRRTRQ